MQARVFLVAIAILMLFGVPAARAAPCSYSNPSACGSPGVNQIAVANGGVLNGTFTGSPAFSGSVTFSGPLTLSGLSVGTQVSCIGLNSSNQPVLAAGACAAGSGITQLTGGVTAGPGSGSQVGTLVLTAGANVTGILSGVNGGTGVANTGKTLTLGGSLTTTGAAAPILAFGSSSFTYTFPGSTSNLAYQVGSFVSGDCLQASGTAGGIADAGAICGSGGSGITQLTGGVTAGPGSGSQVATLVLTAGSGVTGILGGVNGGTGANNGSNTITTSLPFHITGSGTQTFFFGNTGVPWTYNFPQVTANLGYQVGSIVSGDCLQASGTAGGFSDAGAVCGSGGSGITQLTGGVTAGPGSGSQAATLVLTAGAGVTGILSGVNGGTGVANTGKTFTLGGSLSTTGAATPVLAFGSSSFTYTFPVATANLGYQVGSIVSGDCLQASGTAGGFSDAGAVCGSGGSGITQLTGGVTAGPGSGSQAATLVLTAGSGVTGILAGVNGGTGINNSGKTITLGGSLTTTGSAAPTLAFGSSTFTYTFPGATSNLGYQVGSITSGHCLQASGTAGGFADAGSACGSGGSVSITVDPTTPDLVVTPSPITATGVIKTATNLIVNSTTGTYTYNGTGTSGTGTQIDNASVIQLTGASPTFALPQAGTTGFAAGVGSTILFTGTGTLAMTTTTSTICGQASETFQPYQVINVASDGTNWQCAVSFPPTVPSGTIASGKNLGLDFSNRLVTATVTGASFANPTATISGTATNGTATTAMRSDAAPALANTAVTPGSYTATNLTVDQQGRITAAANGTAVPTAANPSATASDTAVNGSATTYMRSDASPAVQKTSSSLFGLAKVDNQTIVAASGVISTTVPIRTVTTSPTVLAADMGGQIVSNVSGGGTITVPAISGTVFANGMSLVIVNYSASTAALSTTPTINAGGGCVSGTGIPSGDTWIMTSNGTTIDCVQTVSVGGGASGANPTATAGPTAVNGSASTFMRSDGAPAVQKGSNAQFGVVEGDGTTVTCVAGVCTAIGAAASSITPGTTTVVGATAPCYIQNSTGTTMACVAVPTLTCDTGFTAVLGQCVWTQTASNVANLTWSGLTRDSYSISCSGILPANNPAAIGLQFGEGAGPTWHTGASDYQPSGVYATSTVNGVLATAANGISLISNGLTSGTLTGNFTGQLLGLTSTTRNKYMNFQSINPQTGNFLQQNGSEWDTNDTAAITAVRLIDLHSSPGNITVGTCTLRQLGS